MSEKKPETITSKIKKAQKLNDWKRVSNLKRELKAKQTKNQMLKSIKNDLETKKIPEENKGFQLLMKMGYKKGEGLGKDSSGMKTPLKINLNSLENKNQAIGIETEKQNIIKQEITKLAEYTEEDYRNRMREKYKKSQLEDSLEDFAEEDLNIDDDDEEEYKNYDFLDLK